MFKNSVLRIPGFRNLWLGQAISQFGDACYYWVFLYVVGEITRSPAMVGYMGIAETIPYLIFGPYAGVLADRVDRRKIMLYTDLCSVAVLLILAITTLLYLEPPLELLFMTAFTLSSVNAFFSPSRGASIPALVPAEQIVEANGISSATQSMAPLIGTTLSGALVGIINSYNADYFFVITVMINMLTFAGSAYFISKLPSLRPDIEAVKHTSPLGDFVSGIQYFWKERVLRALLFAEFIVYLSIAPFMTVYIAVNQQWFGGKPETIAIIEIAAMAGMVAGSLVASKLKIVRPSKNYIFGIGMMGIGVVAMMFSRSLEAFIFWNIIVCFAYPFARVTIESFIQLAVPDAYLGRVNSVLTTLTWGSMPIGMGLAGALIQSVGIEKAFLFMGTGICVGASIGFLSPYFRTAKMPAKHLSIEEAKIFEA